MSFNLSMVYDISEDLRLIIKAKEETNLSLEKDLDDLTVQFKSLQEVSLEKDLDELTVQYKSLQDDSRRRETELLQNLDMLHDKNEVRTS